ncbi:hypothetical protein ABIE71_003990 [Bradyrhizobium diazoefficiens]
MRFKRRHYEEEIDAFDQWIKRMIGGDRSVYFLNFMFRQLPKCERARKELMEDEIRRVYATLARPIRESAAFGPD